MAETERHTVLILGAGASVPYGFPSGAGLVKKICEEFEDMVGQDTKNQHEVGTHMRTKAAEFTRELKQSGRFSIDHFLEDRPNLDDMGKYAIFRVLLPLEDEGALLNVEKDDWYRVFLNWLAPGPAGSFPGHRTSVITYNYDRALEQRLFIALKSAYGLNDAEAAEKVLAVRIIHVHGSFGPLPWQQNNSYISYGGEGFLPIAGMAKQAANNIKIIHEGAGAKSPSLTEACNILSSATEILFFGFGFDPTNLKRLFVPNPIGDRIVYVEGTALGFTQMERHTHQEFIQQLLLSAKVMLYEKFDNTDFMRNTRWFQK